MAWKLINITTPEKWYRSKAWQCGESKWIVAAAFCPYVLGFGGEIITGYGKGAAIFLGPLWIGVAARFEEAPATNEVPL